MSTAPTSTAAAKQRVLVVDDEPQVLIALEDLLSDEYTVLKSDSGERAIDLMRENSDIAVVLSDQRMPQMTGDQLFSKIQDRSRASRVLVTGFADLSAVVRAVNEGRIFAYVDKPWEPERLRLTVDKAAEHYRLQQELRVSEERLRLVVASTGSGLFDWNIATGVVHFSNEFARLLGETRQSLRPSFDSLLFRVHPDDVDVVTARLDSHRDERTPPSNLDCRIRMSNGGYRWFSLSALGMRDANGQRTRLVGAICDVTSRKLQEERLASLSRVRALTTAVNASILRSEDREQLLRHACEVAVRVGQFVFAAALASSRDGSLELVACDSMSETLRDEIPQQLAWERLSRNPSLLRTLTRGSHHAIMDTTATSDDFAGSWFARNGCGALAFFPMFFAGELHGVYALGARSSGYFDASQAELLSELASNLAFGLEHEAKSQRLSFVLSNDPLTGLARRDLFLDRVQQRLAGGGSKAHCLAVFWVDINRFRQVNEALGRAGGDVLLGQVAQRLAEAVGDADGVGRLDANAFGVISSVLDSPSDSVTLLEMILSTLQAPFTVNGAELRIAVTVGVAVFPEDGDGAELLLSRSETAGKVAKSKSQPYAFYAGAMNQRVADRLALENRLRRAIDREEFTLHYQPKVDAKTGKVVGFEALVRWNDPSTGLVPPGSFIPVLEETGLILPVGTWVMEAAARQYTEWRNQGKSPPRIAVNLSAIQLGDNSFDASLDRVLAEYPLAAEGLDLEITESVLMGDFQPNVTKLRRARDLGLRIAIDDFGTGYSSLGYLNRLPLDALKVDRSFVNAMDRGAEDMSLIMTIISLGNSLGLTVIAEGVETQLQAKLLGLLRCDQLQGYLMSRPVPAAEAEHKISETYLLRDSHRPPAA
jgi:diguanylate cyclase (GGDEF)-like protein/PAS domain S-box-containing protein